MSIEMLISVPAAISFILRLFLFFDVSQVAHFLGHVAVDRSSWILCLSLLCVRCTFLFYGVYCLHSVLLRSGLLARVVTRNLFRAIDSCVLFSLVYGGFLDLGEQRVLLAVGTCTALLLHRATVLTLTQKCHYGLSSLASKAPFASSQSSSKTEVRQSDSKGSANT